MNRNFFHSSLSTNIPARLKNLYQWLVWKSRPRTSQDNKFDKVFLNIRAKRRSNHLSADTWATIEQLIEATGYDEIGCAINDPIDRFG